MGPISRTSSNIAELYKNALIDVMAHGEMTKPRGFNCKELQNYVMHLTNPDNNILNDGVRKTNKAFAAAEFLWVLEGRNDVESIAQFNSKLRNYSDDGKTFFGAYGIPFARQIEYILNVLKKDPWTRQGVLTIWRENPPETKDIPCTVALHFMRRPLDRLNLTVYMRSNDIWLGLPYDIHLFTCIQIFVAQTLGILVGSYTHIDGSLHSYEQDFDKIKECIRSLNDDMYEITDINLLLTQKRKVCEEYLKRKNENL